MWFLARMTSSHHHGKFRGGVNHLQPRPNQRLFPRKCKEQVISGMIQKLTCNSHRLYLAGSDRYLPVWHPERTHDRLSLTRSVVQVQSCLWQASIRGLQLGRACEIYTVVHVILHVHNKLSRSLHHRAYTQKRKSTCQQNLFPAGGKQY